MTTSVPRPTFGPTGYIAPEESEILEGVLLDINAAFDGGLNPALETPQGQLASSEAAIIGNVYDEFVYYTTQVDPAYAVGRMQDAIGRIYFLERLPSQPTVVDCLCSGLPGLIIPVGALAVATDGNIYSCTTAGTISTGGSVTLPFECTTVGAIPCPAGSLNAIYQAIPGWDSVTNPADGVIGSDIESRYAFEERRRESVAANAVNTLAAIRGAVRSVSGVLDAYTTENDSGGSVVVGGVTLAAHSLYVAAVGGDNQDVGDAIFTKKAPGCAMVGNTTVTVLDTNAGYTPPFPSYSVTFQRPTSLSILFNVSIINSTLVPANALALIQAAIVAAFAGDDGGPRARIGSTLYAARYVSPVAALGSWAQVSSILVGSNNATGAVAAAASLSGTVMNVTAMTSGAFAIGQTISNTAGTIPAGTRIVSFGTGGGGTGTYNLNRSATVGSGIVRAAVASLSAVVVNINQAPTIAPDNIVLTLV